MSSSSESSCNSSTHTIDENILDKGFGILKDGIGNKLVDNDIVNKMKDNKLMKSLGDNKLVQGLT